MIILSGMFGLVFKGFTLAETKTKSGTVNLSATVPVLIPTPPTPPTPILPPKIFDIEITEITDSSATISWKTNLKSTSKVVYGKTDKLEIGELEDLMFVYEHQIQLVGLDPDTLYFFQIRSKSMAGAEGKSDILSFKTKKDITPPANVSNFEAIPGFHKISLSWTNPPDEDLAGVRIMRSTQYFPLSPSEGTLVFDGLAESFVDENLIPGVRYYYTAFAYDVYGNFASGAITSAVPLPYVGPPPPIPLPPVEIEKLKITDFHFKIAQKTISVVPDPRNILYLLPGTILHIMIEPTKLPQVLKTIMVVIGDKTYLLRIDKSGEYYQGAVVLPLEEGLRPFYILILNFKEGTLDKIEGNVLIEPFGKVKTLNELILKQPGAVLASGEDLYEPVYLAKVTLYQYNEGEGAWKEFPAFVFSQRNPLYSNPRGEYGFLVPKGRYFLRVEKENYQPFKSKEFFTEKNFINMAIVLESLPLPTKLKWKRVIIWILVLLAILTIVVLRREKRKKILERFRKIGDFLRPKIKKAPS